MNERGDRIRAGMMLSRKLREIANEQTELYGNDPDTGNPRLVTKAEALARRMWELALGFEEEVVITDSKTGKPKIIRKVHKPDNAMIAMIFERIEGRVGVPESDRGKKQPLSEKVNDQVRQRINALAKGDDDGGNT